MSARSITLWTIGAVSIACFTLTACSDDTSSEPTTETTGSALTAPGTNLELGEPATVPIGDGVARLTVTAIEPGEPEELTTFGSEADATVSYVWVTVTPVSGDVNDFASFDVIHGWSGDDLIPHVVTDPRTYEACPTRYFPNDGPVAELETCTVFTSATPIDRVGFHDGDAYRRNDDEIIWS